MNTPTTELLVQISVKELYAIIIGVIGYTFLILQSYFRLLSAIKAVTSTSLLLSQEIKDLKIRENKTDQSIRAMEIALAKYTAFEEKPKKFE